MNTFPTLSTRPIFPIESVDEDTVIRTPYEGGYEATRDRASRSREMWDSINWAGMSDANVTTLKTFYRANKALAFNWTHPYSGAAHIVKFSKPPIFRQIGVNVSEVTVALREA